MDLTLVTDELWTAYMKNVADLSRNDISAIVQACKMSDADKVTGLTTFLTDRISANAAAVSALSTYVTDQTAFYTADSALCTTILGS